MRIRIYIGSQIRVLLNNRDFIEPSRAADIAHAVGEFDPDASGLLDAPADPDSDDQAASPVDSIDPIDLLQRQILEKGKLELWWD